MALCDDILEAGVEPLTAVGQQDQAAHSPLDRLMTLGLTAGGLQASRQVPRVQLRGVGGQQVPAAVGQTVSTGR